MASNGIEEIFKVVGPFSFMVIYILTNSGPLQQLWGVRGPPPSIVVIIYLVLSGKRKQNLENFEWSRAEGLNGLTQLLQTKFEHGDIGCARDTQYALMP